MRRLTAFITAGACVFLLALAPQPVMDNAPAFVLKNLDGKEVASSEFAGKVVLLNFWATWCPPCQAEIPALNSLYNDYKSRGLEVVGISVDEDGPAAVKAFVEQRGIDYPILMSSDEVIAAYGGIRGIPTTFLISRDGKIIKKFYGEQAKSRLEDAVKPLI